MPAMSSVEIILHTGGALVGVVLLIILLRMPAVLALVVGALYMGLVTGQGPSASVSNFVDGFGGIMADVGLLIGFGVITGAILAEIGAMSRLVELLDGRIGARRLPYALGATLATLFPAIFIDAMMVLIAPLVRGLARRPGGQLPLLSASVVIGLDLGMILVVPGSAVLAIGGVLDVPLGPLFVLGLLVAVPAGAISLLIIAYMFKRGFWKPERDEDSIAAGLDSVGESESHGAGAGAGAVAVKTRTYSLGVLLSPLLLTLVLIAGGAIATAAGLANPSIDFVTSPVVALFLGVLGSYTLMRRMSGTTRSAEVVESGLLQAGPILLLTGVGGGLASVVAATGLGDILGKLIGTGAGNSLITIVLAWAVAAMLRTATGSPAAGAITTAGILGPVAVGLGTPAVLIALAAGAGGIFGGHVNSNFFWMSQSLLRLTTSGTFRVFTVPTCIVSIVCLPIILGMGAIAAFW